VGAPQTDFAALSLHGAHHERNVLRVQERSSREAYRNRLFASGLSASDEQMQPGFLMLSIGTSGIEKSILLNRDTLLHIQSHGVGNREGGSVSVHDTLVRIQLLICVAVISIMANTITVPTSQVKTISHALREAKSGDTVMVKEGVYREQIILHPGIVLISQSLFKATIKGNGRGICLELSNDNTVTGFAIRDGAIGVLSKGRDNAVDHCLISNNTQTGIMCIGLMPRIQDNVIVYNRGSGIQGTDMRSTGAVIDHNTIAYNKSHGIAFSGDCDVTVKNNIIAFNTRSDIFIESDATRYFLSGNVFFQNGKNISPLPPENIYVNPLFVKPRRMKFNLEKDSPCRRMAADRSDCGARLE